MARCGGAQSERGWQRGGGRVSAAAVAAIAALALTACGSEQQPSTSGPAATPSGPAAVVAAATPTATPTPSPSAPPVTPGATYASPALITVENLSGARPQAGLGSADVVYEYSAEGGISRFTALYFRTPAGQVGPIRSARLISPVLVSIWGGILLSSGSSTYVSGRLQAARTPRYDEDAAGRDMFRLGSRAAPHNLYTDGGRVDDLVRRAARPAAGYTLWARTSTVTGGTAVRGFVAPVSPGERPSYSWRADLGGWVRSEPDTGSFVDSDSGRPVVAATVVVMQVSAHINPADIENGCCTAGWEYTMTGSGAAQVFTGGAGYDATWTQGPSGAPRFTLAGGAPAPIAPGPVWILVVPTGQRAAVH